MLAAYPYLVNCFHLVLLLLHRYSQVTGQLGLRIGLLVLVSDTIDPLESLQGLQLVLEQAPHPDDPEEGV